MKLEVIQSHRNSRTRRVPSFHLGFGNATLSKTLYEMLDNPEYVRFAIDTDERVVGVAKCSEHDDGSIKCSISKKSKVPTLSSAYAAGRILAEAKEKHKTYTFYIEGKEGDYFIAHLDKGETR